ncbi:MAG: response regulator [Sporichthyaceae bacterium]
MPGAIDRSGPALQVVLIEDDDGDAFLVQEYLSEAAGGVELRWAKTIAAARELISPDTDCVLLDLGLPDAVGFSGLDAILERCPRAAVIVLTGLVDEERGLAAVGRGAQEYLQKGQIEPQLLARAIRYAVERKRAQDTARGLAARAEVLADLDKAKSEFLADVSNELRTPLTLISAPLADLLAGAAGKLTDNQRDFVELAHRGTDRLLTLVDGMLNFARLEAGSVIPQLVAVDLARTTAALATNFAPAVEQAGLAFDISTPPLSRPVFVDPDMWSRIVLNLLSNAVKYTLDGEIRVRLSETADGVELLVEDTGIGIDEADLPRLFQRFATFRESGGRSQEGAGIGLAIVSQTLKLIGGSIEVSSTLGKGSAFTVRIPFGEDAARPASAPVDADAGSGAPDAGESARREVLSWDEEPVQMRAARPGRARVLVAEDNADMRLYLCDVLSVDFDVEAVANGEAALFAARRATPDLVLSDVMMPGIDGFALLTEIRNDPGLRTVPVILLSARAGEEAAVEGLAAGADDYIVKPFSSNDLIARIEANLERSRERTRDLAWRNAMLASLTEGVVIADADGTILDMNTAFAQITGYDRAGLPYPVPHPWWPDPDVFPVERAMLDAASAAIFAAGGGDFETLFVHRDGRPIWVAGSIATIEDPSGPTLMTASARDVTRERSGRQRRDAASQLTSELVHQIDLSELQAASVLGFGAVFSGAAVLFEDPGTAALPECVISAAGAHPSEDLPPEVAAAISWARTHDEPQPDDLLPGILLHAQTPSALYGVWVHFPAPRRVSADERVLAGMLGDMLATAKDRAIRESSHTHTEEHLRNALDGQRAVAQAVGILIERHRLTHQAAFDRLREASNRRNVKMRDLAERLVDTGEEP